MENDRSCMSVKTGFLDPFFFWHVAYFVFHFILIHWPGLGFLGLQAISSAIINIIWLKMKKKIISFFSYWKKTYIICYNFNYKLFLVFFISWSQYISNHISAVVSLLTGHSCQRPPLIIRPDFRYTMIANCSSTIPSREATPLTSQLFFIAAGVAS